MTTAVKWDWVRVTKAEPCAICSAPDWCTRTADGRYACCMRVQSPRQLGNGGYLHKLGGVNPREHIPRPRPEPKKLAPETLAAMMNRWVTETPQEALQSLAGGIGVSAQALGRLGAAYAKESSAWAFPMRDADRNIIGIRLRAVSGKKWAVTGSRSGLFLPHGVPGDMVDSLLVCEGPTDCAALLTLNYDVIGRASCNEGAAMLSEILKLDRKDVVIIGDYDEPKVRDDGTVYRPGQDGAQRLALDLRPYARSVRVVYPAQGKDVRDWLKAGANRRTIDNAIQNARTI